MIVFPCCKINLGLHVTERRPDGYHNLQTVFYPVPLEDALEVQPLAAEADEPFRFAQHGTPVDVPAEKNLVVRAYRMLAADRPLPPVDIRLYKRIPSGAGLGGGSADAAFMLTLLNDLFRLSLTDDELERYAARLGADCAFFVRRRPVFAEGIGDVFTPVGLSLAGWQIVVVKPDIFVSTPEAFRGITPRRPPVSLLDVVRQPVSEWRELMRNDFEESIFPRHPRIAQIKRQLYDSGASYAAMSGSGSSVFGLFEAGAPLPPSTEFPDDFYFAGVL